MPIKITFLRKLSTVNLEHVISESLPAFRNVKILKRFRILRGGNKCGIEHNMVVLQTEPRRNKPGVDPVSGCPVNFPKYCSAIKTCRANSQFCMTVRENSSLIYLTTIYTII